jgi:hypothetical protein
VILPASNANTGARRCRPAERAVPAQPNPQRLRTTYGRCPGEGRIRADHAGSGW